MPDGTSKGWLRVRWLHPEVWGQLKVLDQALMPNDPRKSHARQRDLISMGIWLAMKLNGDKLSRSTLVSTLQEVQSLDAMPRG